MKVSNIEGCKSAALHQVSHFKHPQSIYYWLVVWFDPLFTGQDIHAVKFLNLPVYRRRGISQRGWSWVVSRAERCPKPERRGAFSPLTKTFCLAVCRGCLPPYELSVCREVTAAEILLPSPRRFDWSSHHSVSSPVWNRLAGCGSSCCCLFVSPSPERTRDARLFPSPYRGSPLLRPLSVPSPFCFLPKLRKA